MAVAWVIIAHCLQIAASILLAEIFDFEMLTLGPARGSQRRFE
jgi:hypothetical protein